MPLNVRMRVNIRLFTSSGTSRGLPAAACGGCAGSEGLCTFCGLASCRKSYELDRMNTCSVCISNSIPLSLGQSPCRPALCKVVLACTKRVVAEHAALAQAPLMGRTGGRTLAS